MGAFNDLFAPKNRDIPQISVLETIVHYANTPLTAAEIIEMSEVSRRGVYTILQRYVDDGVVIEMPPEEGTRAKRFALNPNDVRAKTLKALEPLLAIGQLESEIKRDEGLPQTEMLGISILNRTSEADRVLTKEAEAGRERNDGH